MSVYSKTELFELKFGEKQKNIILTDLILNPLSPATGEWDQEFWHELVNYEMLIINSGGSAELDKKWGV